ncbi:hypothetical protein [Mycoplasmopsis cynos]|uniref:hypothetical protein n=1 Tax=Mycoplasmopsis cynos TaxID=171284 RepID=UPI0022020036|nr:hypothetical protein [Mycoplasmopsis cynos]UWV93039.1 hypothetical protein NWE57_03485 [Mycoplasmopsis cynos]
MYELTLILVYFVQLLKDHYKLIHNKDHLLKALSTDHNNFEISNLVDVGDELVTSLK